MGKVTGCTLLGSPREIKRDYLYQTTDVNYPCTLSTTQRLAESLILDRAIAMAQTHPLIPHIPRIRLDCGQATLDFVHVFYCFLGFRLDLFAAM